jgi:molybdopterin molybdotransferase
MIPVMEADRLLLNSHRLLGPESVPLTEATGRILRENVLTDRDAPPFHRVAMDGIAITHAAWLAGRRAFRVQGLQKAGEPPMHLADPEACLEIMTGAVLPTASDAVIRYEDIRIADGMAILAEGLSIDAMHNVHLRGADQKEGEVILSAGLRLNATHIAALASVGKSTVTVTARPRIAILSTGDELVDVQEAVLPHQIRRSNSYAMRAALLERGFTDVSLLHVKDDRAALRSTIAEALAKSDVLLLSGGVSMGRFDLVPEILGELGVRNVFHKIMQKPGKPLWFGLTPDGRPVFGLPGNPVSVLVCLVRYVLPFLARASGVEKPAPRAAILPQLPKRKSDFTLFVPVRLAGVEARFVENNGSGDFLSLVASDGFVEITPETQAGTTVPFYSWSGA